MHGPGDPHQLCTWALQQGFSGFVAGPAPRPVAWARVQEQARVLPIRVAAVRVASVLDVERRIDHGIASGTEADQSAALQKVEQAVVLARELGTPLVVVEPGALRVPGEAGQVDLGDPGARWTQDQAKAQLARRNALLHRGLDAACRFFFAATRRFPDVTFCLTGSRHVFGLGEPRALELLFEDLGGRQLRYWHDAPVAACRSQLLDTDQGAWLEAFRDRMVGITLGDVADGILYSPPGSGSVDFPLLSAYASRSAAPPLLDLELDPSVVPGEMPGVRAFLHKYGL